MFVVFVHLVFDDDPFNDKLVPTINQNYLLHTGLWLECHVSDVIAQLCPEQSIHQNLLCFVLCPMLLTIGKFPSRGGHLHADGSKLSLAPSNSSLHITAIRRGVHSTLFHIPQ